MIIINNKETKIIDYYLNHLLKIYTTQMDMTTVDTIILHRIITSMLGDRYIVCPMEKFIDSLLATRNSSIYQYYWQYKGNPRTSIFWNTFQRVWCGKWMGSCHSFEMFAIFGIPFLQPALFDHSDRLVSMELIQMVKYFIHKRYIFFIVFFSRIYQDFPLLLSLLLDDYHGQSWIFIIKYSIILILIMKNLYLEIISRIMIVKKHGIIFYSNKSA